MVSLQMTQGEVSSLEPVRGGCVQASEKEAGLGTRRASECRLEPEHPGTVHPAELPECFQLCQTPAQDRCDISIPSEIIACHRGWK